MADVTFFGIGANGFPDPDVRLLPGTVPPQTGVQFSPGVVPPGANNAIVTFDTPSFISRADVEFSAGRIPVPASLQPNDNDILLIVAGVTGGPSPAFVTINVMLIPAVVPQGDGTIIQRPPVADDLQLFAGPATPEGVVGKTVTFIQPTGASTPSPIRGQTAVIAAIGNPTNPAGNAMQFTTALNVQPTNGDRLFITSDDRTLRRTPLIEVILE